MIVQASSPVPSPHSFAIVASRPRLAFRMPVRMACGMLLYSLCQGCPSGRFLICPSHHSCLKDALHSFSRPSTCFPKRGGMHRALLSTSRSGAIAFHAKKCVPRSERNGVHFARVAISRFGPIAFHARGNVFRTASVTECVLCVSLTLNRLLRPSMCVRYCERNCVYFVAVVM